MICILSPARRNCQEGDIVKKVPTLFARDWDGDRRYVLADVVPGCEWVTKGEGVPTRKYDGTCVALLPGGWFARREVKPGKAAPPNFAALETDEETGKTIGWEPVRQSGFYRWFTEALELTGLSSRVPGTYELIGPKVNGNPESAPRHQLVNHAYAQRLDDAPRTFAELGPWLHA